MRRFFIFTMILLAINCQAEIMSVIHNPDNSVTINHPVLLRGQLKFKISSESTSGICALFNAGYYLKGSILLFRDTKKFEVAVLNELGKAIDFKNSDSAIDAITCFDPSSFSPLLTATSITQSPDGSQLIVAPKMEVGGQTLPLTGFANSICKAFGFPNYLYRSAVLSSRGPSAFIDDVGKFESINFDALYFESLACFNEGEHRDTGSTDDTEEQQVPHPLSSGSSTFFLKQ